MATTDDRRRMANAARSPGTVEDLILELDALARLGSEWSDSIYELWRCAGRLAGASVSASLEVAARRAEQAYLELQIARDDVAAAQDRPRRGT